MRHVHALGTKVTQPGNPASARRGGSRPAGPPSHPRGFALVVTLSLMILLTVIAVGLLSLSAVSLRTTGAQRYASEARSNARLALMLALGELQTAAGADTRVTARADILDENGPPVLGVWKSWEGADHEQSGNLAGQPRSPGNYREQKESRFLRWMVSGDPDDLIDSDSPPAVSAGPARVALVGENTVGSDQPEMQVHLDPVFLKDKKGAYAWWIGGENQKARLPSPHRPVGGGQAGLAAMMKSHSVADPEPFGMDSLLKDSTSTTKAISLKQTDFIDQSADDKASLKHFFDLSTVSTGLLTNTATGGWRKDLSLFTENYDTISSSMSSDLPLFRLNPEEDNSCSLPRGSLSNFRPSGSMLYPWSSYLGSSSNQPRMQQGACASWENLKDYALLYRKFGNSSNFSIEATPLKALTAVERRAYDATRPAHYLHKYRMMPVVARVQWVFSYFGRVGSDGRTYTPGILMTPVFTLWNPYNVTLKNIGPLHFTSGDLDDGYPSPPPKANPSPLPVAFKHEVTDGVPANKSPVFKSLTSGSLLYKTEPYYEAVRDSRYWIADVADLQPGATRVYSPINQDLPRGGREMQPGYNPTGGYLCILRPTSDNGWIYTSNGNARIKLEARFDNSFRLDRTRMSLKTSVDVMGVRLIVRRDASAPGAAATRQEEQMEYRALIPPNTAKDYPELKDLAISKPLGEIRNTYQPFFSLIFGLRLDRNLIEPGAEHSFAKGFLQTSPFTQYTASGDLDSAEPSIVQNYPGTGSNVNSAFDFSFVKHTAIGDNTPSVGPDNSGYILTSLGASGGLNRLIAAELPTQPLSSLGELQNWDLRFGNPVPPYAFNVIGNSDASPLIPSDAVTAGTASETNLQHDDSYCANHLLFDDWFLSSIAGGSPGQFGGTESQIKENFTRFVRGEQPLANRAYKALASDTALAKQSASDADGIFETHANQPESWRTIASRLEVEGMFNVNSTSVTAWRALLGHARDQQVPYYDASGNVKLSPATDHPVSRFSIAGAAEAGAGGSAGVAGYRRLDDGMLDELAERIVDQVRLRGPFLSLSEFVNRQLSNDGDLALAGAVQTALNELGSKLYNNTGGTATSGSVPGADYQFSKAADGSSVFGLPGWTRQADVLRPLAPILSARDDSFTIRGYGDARDAAGNVVATATCEALVRRTRDYVDPADPADSADPPTRETNKTLGRRFEIISFRWLSSNEI